MRVLALLACLLCIAAVSADLDGSNGRKLLKKSGGSCKKPSTKQVAVPGARMVLKMYGKGFRTFWCNGGQLYTTASGKVHGQTQADLVSSDGKYVGYHSYRENYANGDTDGLPYWTIKDKQTGVVVRDILATQKVQARTKVRSELENTRRLVLEDNGSPRALYAIRSNSSSKGRPSKCTGDIDIYVPFTATYTFWTCP